MDTSQNHQQSTEEYDCDCQIVEIGIFVRSHECNLNIWHITKHRCLYIVDE